MTNSQLTTHNTQLPTGYKQTEVGVIPDDWEVKHFSDIGHFKTGPFGTLLKANEYYANEGVPLVSVRDIKDGILVFDQHTPLVPKYVVRRLPEYILNSGDIVIGRKGGVDRSAIVQETQSGCFLGSDGIRIRPNKLHHSPFVIHQLQRKQIRAWLLQNATGTTMPSMNQAILRRVSIPFPPSFAEQEAIAEALGDVDALITALEQLIAKKRHIKQATMQELLTGQTRLPGFTEEWKDIQLGQLGICYRGVSYNPNLDLSPYDTNSTVRLLRSNNIQEAKVVYIDMQYVDKSRVLDVQRLQLNDILICMANGSRELVGKAAKFSSSDSTGYTFGAFMGCFRPDVQVMDSSLVFYLFQTEAYRSHVAVLLAGSSINNLKPSDIESLTVKVPSNRSEQTAIATILSDMDAAITTLETKLHKTRLLKQGMMQELLTGRIRLLDQVQK